MNDETPNDKLAYRSRWFLAGLVLLFESTSSLATSYSVAVVPQLPAEVIHRNWGPLLHAISVQINTDLELTIYPGYREFELAVLKGIPDIVYMNPYHQLSAYKDQGYIPLLRDDATMLTGILVVRKDSPYLDIKDLAGKTLAFPSPNAFAASLYLRAMLASAGIVHATEYVNSHTNVYRNVARGLVAAGGGVNKTFDMELPATKEQLRTIYRVPGVASHPLSVHPRLPAAIREDIIRAFLQLQQQHSPLLNAIQMQSPVRANFERDYAPLKALNLDRFLEPYLEEIETGPNREVSQ